MIMNGFHTVGKLLVAAHKYIFLTLFCHLLLLDKDKQKSECFLFTLYFLINMIFTVKNSDLVHNLHFLSFT